MILKARNAVTSVCETSFAFGVRKDNLKVSLDTAYKSR